MPSRPAPLKLCCAAPGDSRTRAGSFDDLIRPQQQRRRDGEAEGLRGFEVDDELEFRRLLDGEIGGLGSLKILSTYVAARRNSSGPIGP
jgi:hypothetical protein